MWNICFEFFGQDTLEIKIQGMKSAIEKAYLKAKKVNGGELGMPNLATMKPVLQMSTNTAGMAMIHLLERLNFWMIKKKFL
jgi:hypothetical protein